MLPGMIPGLAFMAGLREDQYFANVVLLLHCDGADASTTFTDSGSFGFTVNVAGNAQIDTAQSKFGGASGLLDGSGDLIYVNYDGMLAPYDHDFTWEAFVRPSNVSGFQTIWHLGATSSYGPFLVAQSGSTFVFYSTTASGSWNVASGVSMGTAAANTWTHLAVVRTGSSIKLFNNGIKIGSDISVSGALYDPAQPAYIGGQGASAYFAGWVDDVRYTIGVARYTGNFTVPADPFPNSGPQAATVETISSILTDLDLTDGLKLCLDAADSNSYNPSVQTAKWLDVSGNGYDFYRGTSTGGDAAEPFFYSIGGNRHFRFDGADYFTYDTTNETWMENLHKDGAKFAAAAWIYLPTVIVASPVSASHIIFSDNGVDTNYIGASLHVRPSNGVLRLTIEHASASTNALRVDSTAVVSSGTWTFVAVRVDEATGGGMLQVQGTQESFVSTYSSPSASNATFPMCIGYDGEAGGPALSVNGDRIAGLVIWEGSTIPEDSDLAALFEATRSRYGV